MDSERLVVLEILVKQIDNNLVELNKRIKPIETHVLMMNSFVKFAGGLTGLGAFAIICIKLWGAAHGQQP